jgi:hypothetical protein
LVFLNLLDGLKSVLVLVASADNFCHATRIQLDVGRQANTHIRNVNLCDITLLVIIVVITLEIRCNRTQRLLDSIGVLANRCTSLAISMRALSDEAHTEDETYLEEDQTLLYLSSQCLSKLLRWHI